MDFPTTGMKKGDQKAVLVDHIWTWEECMDEGDDENAWGSSIQSGRSYYYFYEQNLVGHVRENDIVIVELLDKRKNKWRVADEN